MIAAFARKLGMTHIYDDKNRHVPVTILKMADQVVTSVQSNENESQALVQIGAVTSKHINKPQKDELAKLNIDTPATKRKQISLTDTSDISVGTKITVAHFSLGDSLAVTSTSKGKGFSGGIKRHGWSRGPMSHGSKHHRAPGSIGSGYPQRVVPGKKLPGHHGQATVSTKGHKIVGINEQNNTLAVTGPIAGPNKSFVFIRNEK